MASLLALPADAGTLGTFGTLLRKTEGVDTRHQRSMQKWEAYSKQWTTIQKSLALQVGRQPERLVMERLDAYRKRIEAKDAMGQAVPADVSNPTPPFLSVSRFIVSRSSSNI